MKPSPHIKPLITLALITAAVLALFWLVIIRTEKKWIKENADRLGELREQTEAARRIAGNYDRLQENLALSSNLLQTLEASMPAGDVYRWVVRTFVNRADKSVLVIETDPPKPASLEIPTNMPYQAATFVIDGKATYHDFGRFLAEVENQFVHLRVVKLELEPAAPDLLDTTDANRLLFKLELLTIAKSLGK